MGRHSRSARALLFILGMCVVVAVVVYVIVWRSSGRGELVDLFANVLLLLCAVRVIRPGHVQGRIDHLGDGLDLGAELLLDAVKIEPIFVGD